MAGGTPVESPEVSIPSKPGRVLQEQEAFNAEAEDSFNPVQAGKGSARKRLKGAFEPSLRFNPVQAGKGSASAVYESGRVVETGFNPVQAGKGSAS